MRAGGGGEGCGGRVERHRPLPGRQASRQQVVANDDARTDGRAGPGPGPSAPYGARVLATRAVQPCAHALTASAVMARQGRMAATPDASHYRAAALLLLLLLLWSGEADPDRPHPHQRWRTYICSTCSGRGRGRVRVGGQGGRPARASGWRLGRVSGWPCSRNDKWAAPCAGSPPPPPPRPPILYARR